MRIVNAVREESHISSEIRSLQRSCIDIVELWAIFGHAFQTFFIFEMNTYISTTVRLQMQRHFYTWWGNSSHLSAGKVNHKASSLHDEESSWTPFTMRYLNLYVLQVGRHCAIWRHQNNPSFRPNSSSEVNLNELRKAIILTASNRIILLSWLLMRV